jgi:hypothetical protein
VTDLGREQEAPALTAPPARRPSVTLARRAGQAVLVVAAAVALYFCYWRQSLAVGLSSDGSGNILQAWDMLHGNLLLSHWWVSDVSFYTTELPQYVLIEALTGLGPWVVHAAAAMTYTLLVLLGAVLARGATPRNPPGTGGLLAPPYPPRPCPPGGRALLAAGLMVSPQLSATSILLLSPDHIGTAVPLLVVWLLIDRCRARWYVPVLVFVLFTLTMVGDPIVLLTGIAPLVLVGAGRGLTGLIRRGVRHVPAWYELSLAAAAGAAAAAGSYGPRVMAALGGYQQSPVGADTDLSQLQHGSWVTLQAFLELFGANIINPGFYGTRTTAEVVFVSLHLAGALVAACGLGIGLVRIFRAGELIVPVFAVAIVANLVAYMISTHAQDLLGSREMAEVLPLGAVLAGRVLGDRLAAWTRAPRYWLAPLLVLLGAGYLAALGFGASQPARPGPNEPLAAWLTAHGLTGGLATYWQANSTNVDSGGRLVLSAVVQDVSDRLVPYLWETDEATYDPARRYANFVVADGPSALPGMKLSAQLTFGRPARIYQADGYTIMVWDKNLLAELDGPGLS